MCEGSECLAATADDHTLAELFWRLRQERLLGCVLRTITVRKKSFRIPASTFTPMR